MVPTHPVIAALDIPLSAFDAKRGFEKENFLALFTAKRKRGPPREA